MKKYLLTIGLILALSLALFSSAYAVQIFWKQVTGVGVVKYTAEITVSNVLITSSTEITVSVTSTTNTAAGTSYTITLYLDGVNAGAGAISWTNAQIPGTTKTIIFSGLSLGVVSNLGVEITK